MATVNCKRVIKDKIPILKWLPQYKQEDALGDLVAGITVGLTLIPQVHKMTYICLIALCYSVAIRSVLKKKT